MSKTNKDLSGIKLDGKSIIQELKEKEIPKQYDTLRINKLIVDAYREYAASVGIKRHGNLIEKVLLAGLEELRRQTGKE